MFLAQPNAWMETVVYFTTERESQRDHRQNLYLKIYGKYFLMAVEQGIGNSPVYADVSVGENNSALHCTKLSPAGLLVHLRKKLIWI